jgi:hypothetical protein
MPPVGRMMSVQQAADAINYVRGRFASSRKTTCSTRSDAIRPREVLARRGMTLDQLGQILALHSFTVEVRHAAAGGIDEFRKSPTEYLAAKDHFVVVN